MKPSLLLVLGASTVAAAPALALAAHQDEDCALSEADARWIESSVAAWRHVARTTLQLEHPPSPFAVFFDAHCVRSTEELRLDGREQEWDTFPHGAQILLPDGNALPAVVTSFAAPLGEGDGSFFVMSTPSVWRAGGVPSEMPLETLMTAVLLHEISHTSQFATYMRRVSELEAAGNFGEDLTDDFLQDTFGGDAEFAGAVEREIDLLFRAAAADDSAEALRLAREARDSIAARREGYRDRPQVQELEDLFLTLEGAAQWAAFTWLKSPDGGNVEPELAMRDFGRRTDYWSQIEGLGLFLVIDRFVPAWVREVYGKGGMTALGLLDRALK